MPKKHRYVDEEPMPMKIIDAYFLLRTITALVGFILYFSDKFYYTRYGFLSYIGFMFEDLTIYAISPIIPLIHAFAFGICFIGLRKDIGIVRLLAIILLFIDIFALPVGTIISLIMIIYLLLPSTAKYFTPIAKKTTSYRVIGIVILAFSLIGFFATSGISENIIPTSEQVMPTLSAVDKIDKSIDLTASESTDVIIELYYSTSMLQSVEMQSVVLQGISVMGGTVTDTTTKVLNSIVATVPNDKLTNIATNYNVKRIIKDEPVVRLWGFVDEQAQPFHCTPGVDCPWDLDGNILYPVEKLLNENTSTATGRGIVVAIVDSGINSKMQWLQRDGKSVVIDSYQLYGEYVLWHGTAVACCIASQNPEVRGVAPNVDLLNVEVFLPDGQAKYSDIISGWEWVVEWKEQHPDKFVICSNSLGVPSDSPGILDTALDNIVLRYGIPMVVASGNLHPQYKICSPGMGRYALTIGAVDSQGNIADFSCRGNIYGLKKPDVCALGVHVATFDPDGFMITPSGTSFSTPIVAGAMALLAENNPDYDVFQLYDAMRNGAKDAGEIGFDEDYGYGIADLAGAEQSLNGEKPSRYYVYLFALLPIIAIIVMFYPEIDKKLNLY